jgi:hypothetical protein
VSRSVDTDTAGKLDLINPDSNDILDVQAIINENILDIITAESDIDALEASRVVGPVLATDNTLARYDGTTGKLIQPSGILVDDSDNVTIPGNVIIQGNATINGTTTNVNTDNLNVEDKNILVNVGGTDITADGSGLTVERTGVSGSLIYDQALASKWKAGDVGTEKQVVTVSDTQVLTNKDYDGGSASTSSRFTLSKDTLSNITALARKAGTVYYATDDGKIYYDNGTSLLAIDGGASAAISSTLGSADANKSIKTNASGLLDKTFLKTFNTFASDGAAATFFGTLVGGEIYYNTTDNKYKYYDFVATVWREIGSGSSAGEKNYILNGSAQDNTAGWALYLDTPGQFPVDGSGGTALGTTFTRSTTNPLSNPASFIYTKDSVNRQGEGAGYNFTIDLSQRAKVLTINFYYLVNSGTFTAGTSSTNSDVIVYIYDTVNNTLIEPSNRKLFSGSTTLSDRFQASFQASFNSSSYRLIFHNASTTINAFSLKIDDISVAPNKYVYGTPITDWQTFTPTGTWTTNTTYLGRYRRVGDSAEFEIEAGTSGAPNAVALSLNLPPGLVIDTTKMVSGGNPDRSPFGIVTVLDASISSYLGRVDYSSPTSVRVLLANTASTYATGALVSSTVPFSFGAGDKVTAKFSTPILGWSSSVQMSDQTDTRITVGNMLRVANQSVASNTATKLTFDTVASDNFGGMNTTLSRVDIRVAGSYNIYARGVYQIAGGTLNSAFTLQLWKNGVSLGAIAQQDAVAATYTQVPLFLTGTFRLDDLKDGDYLELYALHVNTGVTRNVAEAQIRVDRLTGTSAIAVSEIDVVRARCTSAQSITTSFTDLIFNAVDSNRFGSYNSTTGVYACSKSTNLLISARASTASLTLPATNGLVISIFKNGVEHSRSSTPGNGSSNIFTAQVLDNVDVVSGDLIKVQVLCDTATTVNALAIRTTLSIKG